MASDRAGRLCSHLVDCNLPVLPIPRFVPSLPSELSLLAATKPEVLCAIARISADGLARHYRQAASRAPRQASGAVAWVKRVGITLPRRFPNPLDKLLLPPAEHGKPTSRVL